MPFADNVTHHDIEQLEHFIEDVRELWAKVPTLDDRQKTKDIQEAIDGVAEMCK